MRVYLRAAGWLPAPFDSIDSCILYSRILGSAPRLGSMGLLRRVLYSICIRGNDSRMGRAEAGKELSGKEGADVT